MGESMDAFYCVSSSARVTASGANRCMRRSFKRLAKCVLAALPFFEDQWGLGNPGGCIALKFCDYPSICP